MVYIKNVPLLLIKEIFHADIKSNTGESKRGGYKGVGCIWGEGDKYVFCL